jgi:putative heme-binding domain-containing protein
MAKLSLAAFFTLSMASVVAAEPELWADPKLPVRDGLELWLDASRALDKPPAADGKLTMWRDASGHGRHVRQNAAGARPTLIQAGGAAIVRFDGEGTHLRAVKLGRELKSVTVIMVLAPRQNLAPFRGFLAFNAAGQRDYTSGLNIDLGPSATPRFTSVNIEGRGFGGAQNLRRGDGPFGRLHILEVASDAEKKIVRLAIDGKVEGSRPRDGAPISMDEITIGARFYENGPGPQHADGFARCDIAEVLVYDRALSEAESSTVRQYLDAKYADLKNSLPPDGDGGGEVLTPVKDPPPVQMFLPGFTVRELPVDLTNINNVKYRPDGTLVALAYNGNVWLLRDTDGDGLEDKAELFWENKGALRGPIGMDLTPPNYKLGEGVFVASKGRLTLLADTKGTGKADKEIIVAGGWPEIFPAVDTLGVAFDRRDGSIYYGRGCANFTDAYQRDPAGKAHYSLSDETGTIIHVSPDFKSREIVATGIRFSVALAFNRHGDLFATDQEGATWLPNGNPLDELLHIQKGRHYGFPPRHPKHLPNVIDEPSTFDYGPQHQSTCGLNFNEPIKPGGAIFGPKAWAGDALITGESRGKLYRTQLVKTPAGYVARTQLIACLNMLAVDACVSPDGGLVVACHSGGPDWGSGPTGKGKLFKIMFTDAEHPQPVFVWPAGPREVRVEFDRPVDPQLLRGLLQQTKITAGQYVRAGDRFESLWPGYAVVQVQKATPRYDVPVRSAQLTPDHRTLILAIDAQTAAVHYAVTLPGMGRPSREQTPKGKGAKPQYPQIDLEYDLSACEATWTPAGGGPGWSGWLPHLDLQAARELTAGSAPHDALWALMSKPGELKLKGLLDLTDMLRPAVQPGSRIEYEWPPEDVTVEFASRSEFWVSTPAAKVTSVYSVHDGTSSGFTVRPQRGKPVPVEVRIKTGTDAALAMSYFTNEDKRPRPFQLHRILVPWADVNAKSLSQPLLAVRPKELEGGSWARGHKEFFGEQAACAKCHAIDGQGGSIGPDLSNLIHRDYVSVLRDITQPSFAINPDHVTYVVDLKDGRTLTGVVQSAGSKLRIGDNKGVLTEIDRAAVESMKPSAVSTMPDDLLKPLGPARTRDLLTFLLTPPPHMPHDFPGARPKPRPVAEVHAALAGAPNPPEKTRPIRVVLVAGPKDHGQGEHDYPAFQKAWAELLSAADKIEVATAWEWPTKDEFQKADVMVFFQRGDWNAQRAADIDAFLDRGGGLVYIHWAVDGRTNALEFAKRIGLAGSGGSISYRHGELTLTFNREAKHPVTRNFDKLALVDETYWKMPGELTPDRLIATAVEEARPQPQLWSLERGNGRVFVSIPGHYSWTFDDPLFRLLLLRAIAWTAKEPVDRFNDLVWPGAEVAR